MREVSQDELNVILQHSKDLEPYLDSRGFRKEEELQCVREFILLYVLQEYKELNYYSNRREFGKWNSLALSLSNINQVDVHLRDSEKVDVVQVITNMLTHIFEQDIEAKPKQEVKNISRLGRLLHKWDPENSLGYVFADFRPNTTPNSKDYEGLKHKMLRKCWELGVYEFYVEGVKAQVFPKLDWKSFRKVVMTRLGHDLWTEGLEHLIDLESLKNEELYLLLDMGWLSNALVKECFKRDYHPIEISGYWDVMNTYAAEMKVNEIQTIEEAVELFLELKPLEQYKVYKKFDQETQTLGEIPFKVKTFNILLLNNEYEELGLLSKPECITG